MQKNAQDRNQAKRERGRARRNNLMAEQKDKINTRRRAPNFHYMY